MQPATFDYHRPSSLEEALSMLGSIDGARPLAGGHSLLPLMKQRLAAPPALVDLGALPGLRGVAEADGDLVIGALTTHADVASSDLVWAKCPVLAEAASKIGDPQVRNRGTIGGSVAHADPAADYPTVLMALGATVVATGPNGQRTITAPACFTDMFTTSLEPGELVTAVRVPVLGDGTGASYVKHRHPASSYAVVGVAAIVGMEGGTCGDVRIAVGGVTATPVRATAAEQALAGQAPDPDTIAAAAALVADAITDPIGDLYASGEYRVHLATVLAKRAIGNAVTRA